jgi:hypothetical protein
MLDTAAMMQLYKENMGKLSSALKKADTSDTYPYGATNFIPALAIRFRIANSCTSCREIFTELSQDGERADFSKNLRASLFNKDLSNGPNFGRIHLAGQYL